ncbi:hypothetical protein C8F04DRAFT_1064761 [Mycena alexandri]|uniref:Uncharacterized protein n=1 Tax=Mycena alexandri TaxID=1745969 RepID=A0AAD6TFY1_9AGAR|nr:hypothetical protein C8F04DRAFT_1064761 [Mycena alexandri]
MSTFPKGPRFEPQQISDVPGPNSYNLYQESQLDPYKRGAFLEKADRFVKYSPSEVPGPGAYNTNGKPDTKSHSKPSANLGDRYAILQRKVEDLERIHGDGKKAHQAEVDRLKLELSRSQKANTEHLDRLEKQKKQSAILDVRVQDLKKASATEQAELKDLRVKLRMSEHERTQLAAKQGEGGELKKAMQSLESKRREEIRERDRTIADLEKSGAAEKRKREMAEARLQELHGKGDADVRIARAQTQSLQSELAQSQEETRQALQSLATTETDAASEQNSLLKQLEHHRLLLMRAAEEYGRLAAESVSANAHAKLKHDHRVLQQRAWRLERKAANSDGQITELVSLIRHAHDTNSLLVREIHDLHQECDFYRRTHAPSDRRRDSPRLVQLYDALTTAMRELHVDELSVHQSDSALATDLAELYRLTCNELGTEYATADAEVKQEQVISKDLRVELSDVQMGRQTLEEECSKARQERDDLFNQLSATSREMDELKISAATAEQKTSELEHRLEATVHQSEMTASNDKKALQQLTETVKKSRMAEDGLRAEIDILTTDLADLDQFQAAYYSLSDEIKSLIARNELAEGEAEQLSKLNAEILGHNNPAQRILYVDRIRRELAEIKHKLAVTVVECETAAAHNVELVRELEMYKSASVPLENKPRTVVTRISRPPLSNFNYSTPPTGVNTIREAKETEQRFEDFSFAI